MGKVDKLVGLKENIIMGHLIPAGTGYRVHRDIGMEREILKSIITEEETSGETEE